MDFMDFTDFTDSGSKDGATRNRPLNRLDRRPS